MLDVFTGAEKDTLTTGFSFTLKNLLLLLELSLTVMLSTLKATGAGGGLVPLSFLQEKIIMIAAR
jgi:hypothetical protein